LRLGLHSRWRPKFWGSELNRRWQRKPSGCLLTEVMTTEGACDVGDDFFVPKSPDGEGRVRPGSHSASDEDSGGLRSKLRKLFGRGKKGRHSTSEELYWVPEEVPPYAPPSPQWTLPSPTQDSLRRAEAHGFVTAQSLESRPLDSPQQWGERPAWPQPSPQSWQEQPEPAFEPSSSAVPMPGRDWSQSYAPHAATAEGIPQQWQTSGQGESSSGSTGPSPQVLEYGRSATAPHTVDAEGRRPEGFQGYGGPSSPTVAGQPYSEAGAAGSAVPGFAPAVGAEGPPGEIRDSSFPVDNRTPEQLGSGSQGEAGEQDSGITILEKSTQPIAAQIADLGLDLEAEQSQTSHDRPPVAYDDYRYASSPDRSTLEHVYLPASPPEPMPGTTSAFESLEEQAPPEPPPPPPIAVARSTGDYSAQAASVARAVSGEQVLPPTASDRPGGAAEAVSAGKSGFGTAPTPASTEASSAGGESGSVGRLGEKRTGPPAFAAEPDVRHVVLGFKDGTAVFLEPNHPLFSLFFQWSELVAGPTTPAKMYVRRSAQPKFYVGKRAGTRKRPKKEPRA
jgi:hypothetical protein